ncbi:MAG: hypothetical protein QGI38_03535 [Candidatus Woesearchaeota archaeon]|jgi:hypothetical protein|nr:hypothetical protein [Candidatus Woesearchaeota archaeon]|tara:strand:+ start:4572 stop:5057 length:486 start_codon:yes stop_codon:yes gene_type:complete
MIKDLEVFGVSNPYYFIAYGVNDEDFLEIEIMTAKGYINTKEEAYHEALNGLLRNRNLDEKNFTNSTKIVNSNGIEAMTHEFYGYSIFAEQEMYNKIAIFLNQFESYMVMMSFSASKDYEGYVEEFDYMIDTFNFKSEDVNAISTVKGKSQIITGEENIEI